MNKEIEKEILQIKYHLHEILGMISGLISNLDGILNEKDLKK